MNSMLQDIRFAARMLARNPLMTVVAATTLALGIGANTAIFTVVDAVLFRPLPYATPDRLVQVWETDRERGGQSVLSPLNYRDLLDRSRSIEAGALYAYDRVVVTGQGDAQRIRAIRVTSGFFPVLGVQPRLGRWFRADEDAPGTRSVIISEGFWERQFARNPGVLGRPLTLNGRDYEVVGVMPAGFEFPGRVDLWTTMALDYGSISRGSHYLFGIARLQEGRTLTATRDEVNAIATALEQAFPDTNGRLTWRLVPLRREIVGNASTALIALLVAVGFILLIACANVVNLVLARASGRTSEIAVRRALGAGTRRLTWQFLTEGVLLTAFGGFIGFLLAIQGVNALVSFNRALLPRADEIHFRPATFAFALGLLLAVALVLGVAQALVFARGDTAAALREGGRSGSAGRKGNRVRDALAITQIALALPLLVGASLLVRTLYELQHVRTGFNAEHVLTLDVSISDERYPGGQRQIDYATAVLGRVEALPGVLSAGIVNDLPFAGSRSTSTFGIEGREPTEEDFSADARIVTPRYFDAMQLGIVRGRGFTNADRSGASPVLIINQTFARRFFPDEDPIGARIETRNGEFSEVVGIVSDLIHDDLTAEPNAEMYAPFLQTPLSRLFLAVRTSGDAEALSESVRKAILEVDPLQPASASITMQRRVDQSVAPQRSTLLLLALLALLALVLAIVGLYGVIGFSVARRFREMGIRIALGARPADIERLILRQATVVIAIGLAAGLTIAIAVAGSLRGLLFGVRAVDPLTLLAVTVVLGGVGLAASWLPARRATRADPITTLRQE
jgi:putative ABC transport system permease protein